MLLKIDLPSLNKGDIVIGANLRVAAYHKSFYTDVMEDQQIDAHVITESWNYTTATWNNQPDYENIICAQPFGCLPNHIVGRGAVRKILDKNPNANIVVIDYDPSQSKINKNSKEKSALCQPHWRPKWREKSVLLILSLPKTPIVLLIMDNLYLL